MSDLTNAQFAGYAARIAQKAGGWAADTVQGFGFDPPDEAIQRETVLRFVSGIRLILDHMERQTGP